MKLNYLDLQILNEFTHFALQFLGEIISTEKTLLFGDVNILLRAYKVYVRPLVQRNFIIWSPSTLSDIASLESLQRRFTKRLSGLHSLSF